MEIHRGATLGEHHRSFVELVAEKLQHKREADPAGITCLSWLSVLPGIPGVDPAFHALLAQKMREQSPVSCVALRSSLAHLMRS